MGNRTRLILHAQCADDAARAAITLARPAIIALPSLRSRHAEIERLVQECADDAAVLVGAPATGFTMDDLDRLVSLDHRSIAELETTVRRLVVLRTWGVSGGAARLGISHVALLRWAQRRKLKT